MEQVVDPGYRPLSTLLGNHLGIDSVGSESLVGSTPRTHLEIFGVTKNRSSFVRVPFKGEKFEYGPDFTPQGKWWLCVGKPWCPALFVVASEVAQIEGPLSGFAGTVYFVWTPFGLIHVAEDSVWVS
jgi:hypothetical protein